MTTQQRKPGMLSRGSGIVGASFVADVIGELRKVVWPTREEATRLTVMVIGVSLVVGAVLGLLDLGFRDLITKVIID